MTYSATAGIHWVRRLAMPVHRNLRQAKVSMFFGKLEPTPTDTLLDIGGTVGMAGEFSPIYDFFQDVTTLNLEPPPAGTGRARFVQGDARKMPFLDASFDWVFSNAVIEHVGDFQQQQRMAAEVRRVARKGYFIATPNKRFPIDPHTYLPFFHLLPERVRVGLARSILRKYLWQEDYWMLSARDLRRLFPGGQVLSSGFQTSLISLARRA